MVPLVAYTESKALDLVVTAFQVAMNRAQVCLISSSKSGERHLYLIKVSRDKISDNDDQETTNCDAKGRVCTHTHWDVCLL